MKYLEWMDSQPLIVKILLSIFWLDYTWAAYRIVKAVLDKDNTALVYAIILAVLTTFFWWIVDLVSLIINKKILFFK